MAQVQTHQDNLEIIVGTYEDYVVGYQVETIATNKKVLAAANADGDQHDRDHQDNNQQHTIETPRKKLKNENAHRKASRRDQGEAKQANNNQRLELEQSFAVRSHSGSVRCLAASSDGSLVFSAGYDEMMNLFNLRKRKLLQTSEGAVNCATFVGSSHLICGSENGNMYIYECKGSSMVLAKTLKGHKDAVSSIDAHPSGKILLSISKDRTMRTWNLIKGRCPYVTQIKPESQLVKWSRAGEEFLIAANNEIYLYNNLGNLRQCIKLEKRVNSIEFITKDIFAVAIDSGKLELFDLSQTECLSVSKLDAHGTRIKSIKCLTASESHPSDGDNEISEQTSTKGSYVRFATAASDGSVKIWSMTRMRDTLKNPRELATIDIGARITCMIISRRAPLSNE